MKDARVQIPAEVKLVFSRCDICEKPYDEDEKKIMNATSEYSDEERHEPVLLLCDSCHRDLEVLPTYNS